MIFVVISCRLGENLPFRGRQVLCKYYKNNEILSEQLLRIKSAKTTKEIKELLVYHHKKVKRNNSSVPIGKHYDCNKILEAKRGHVKPCSCKLSNYGKISTDQSTTTNNANAIKTGKRKTSENTVDDFIRLASQCYKNYIQSHFNELNWCSKKVILVGEQQQNFLKRDNRVSLAAKNIWVF